MTTLQLANIRRTPSKPGRSNLEFTTLFFLIELPFSLPRVPPQSKRVPAVTFSAHGGKSHSPLFIIYRGNSNFYCCPNTHHITKFILMLKVHGQFTFPSWKTAHQISLARPVATCRLAPNMAT